MLKREFNIFLTTLSFFTQIPLRNFKGFKKEYLNKCNRYFPVIGYIVGGLSFLFFWISSLVFPTSIAVIIALGVGILITGAFHEDGFANIFDGFGGGWTKSRILEIMKDSRLGTYGIIALILMLLLKFYLLTTLGDMLSTNLVLLALIFVTYHALARTTAVSISFLLPYSREDEKSKSKPIAKSYTWKEILGAFVFGFLPFLFLLSYALAFVWILPVLALLVAYSRYYFKKWIDGFTGDCLGGVEQFAELFILLIVVAVCKYI